MISPTSSKKKDCYNDYCNRYRVGEKCRTTKHHCICSNSMVLIYREVPWEWNCMKWGFTCTMHLQGKLPCRCIWMRGLGTSVKPIGQQVTAALLIGTSSHSQRSPAARNLRLCCSHNLKFLLWWILRGRQAKTFHLLSSGNLNTMPSPPPSQPAPEASCSLGVQGAEGKRTQPRNSLNLHQKP